MGLGNAKPNTPAGHRCTGHTDRFAAVRVNGDGKCWECYLGKEAFALRFAADYYDKSTGGH
jgi:hypothetical protein